MPRTPYPRCVRGTRPALPPQTGQLREKPFEAVTLRRFPRFRGIRRHQGLLDFTDGMQQEHQVQPSPIFLKKGLQIRAGGAVLDQSIAGSGGLTVAFDGSGAVPGLVDQLE